MPNVTLPHPRPTDVATGDRPSRSPWIAQLVPDGPPRPLVEDAEADVAIVGAGIAGVATAYFTLRATRSRVILVERDRVARGATGRNAGQLTTYFERPLSDIAEAYGDGLAIDAQRAFDEAHVLLDDMAADVRSTVRIEWFTGHMGMFTLDQVLVHLRNARLRRDGGLAPETCVVSEAAPFLGGIPDEFASLYRVVPRGRIRDLLETDDDRYQAVLSDRKGCINGAAFVQEVLASLEARYRDRFRFVDHTPVERIVVGDDGAVLRARGHSIAVTRVVLCTNGYIDHVVEDRDGARIDLSAAQRIAGTVGYMAAFVEDEPRPPAAMSYIRNVTVGSGETPYVYVTRRTYDRADGPVTLTCMGGPEHPLDGPGYDSLAEVPATILAEMDATIRPFAQPGRRAGRPFDFQWHGLMGYNEGLVRVIGAHPRHRALLYNLGCNGVGFLPSISGGHRVARLLAGEVLGPSIFDPT